ncbi:70dddb5d-2b6c-4512-bab2-1054921963d9 [Thermothielavioides terrestris]|jgi:hypothetical protein|uniref:Uncharacterized protein n=2 Tax=Thermothielavioides terrestris TaxID=2587410 RepID=G2QSI5_THETT|nr:uncharacterized protein THITE_2169469 [Thermothielavioides terrestris NRRL 8126]AEO63467.1 hypothetical protein THITE_2169469 [Thermothielavioides terrestris NRRL 8126]SPQ21041.1 70dddb5d-2b6c-4512-bab2-1054921963d9 [Thermothielavioides terrestris]
MEAIATRPVLLPCCRRAVTASSGPSRLVLNTLPSGARQKSSAARTRRALRIPPHPSFFAGPDGGTARPTTDEIIFNPPSSEPSVYHTPFKFLPKTDPRRRANLTSELLASSTTIQYPSSSSSSSSTATAPKSPEDFPALGRVPTQDKPPHHLTKADIEEMRRLRAEDPVTNSVQTLARRFGCSKLFVLMCCQAPPEHRARVQAELEATQARWGPRRRAAREERARRFAMLFNGEL